MTKLRETNDNPGICRACKGTGWVSRYLDEISKPIDERCPSCQGTGHQSQRQIVMNEGANALILGSMPW